MDPLARSVSHVCGPDCDSVARCVACHEPMEGMGELCDACAEAQAQSALEGR